MVEIRGIRSHFKDHVFALDLYMRRWSGTTIPLIHIEVEIEVSIDVHVNLQRRIITVTINVPISRCRSPRRWS